MARGKASSQKPTYLEIRERIALNGLLLASLNDVPGLEEEFQLNSKAGYQLPVAREQQLSEAFAFLAANTHDTRNVIAAAIEEDEDKQGMTIRFAANQGHHTIDQPGLEAIADILQRAATRVESRKDLQPYLLTRIVELDISRILSRLRSKHAPVGSRKPDRTSVVRHLHRQVHAETSIKAHDEKASLREIQRQSTSLNLLFNQLESLQLEHVKDRAGQVLVGQILEKIANMANDVGKWNLTYFLQRSKLIDSSLIISLPLSMSKLARYYTLSFSLLDAARDSRYTVFKNIRIVLLDSENYRTRSIITRNHPINEVLRWHQKLPDNNTAREAPEKQTTFTNKGKKWNIHAEVQLLYFYTMKQSSCLPRVLSSSKSACYLCSLFIRTHGTFQVPRTHGRLYASWTLPNLPDNDNQSALVDAAAKLDIALARQIKSTLVGQTKPLPRPTESVVAVHTPWSPSSTFIISRANSDRRGPTTSTRPTSSSSSLSSRGQSPFGFAVVSEESPAGDTGSQRSLTPTQAVKEEQDQTPMKPEQNREVSHTPLPGNNDGSISLQKTWQCYNFSDAASSYWFKHDGLELFIDSDIPGTSLDKDQWIGLKYVDQSRETQGSLQGEVIDLARTDWSTYDSTFGSAKSHKPLALLSSRTIFLVKFGLDSGPADPIPPPNQADGPDE